jgi:Zn-dependent protease/CBS domain-containing protein
MMGGFKIGRIFGITVRIDWSWIFIFLLVTWSLASSFGTVHQNWSVALRWGTAAGASIIFFVSVLAHEFAHSLYARSKGVPVSSITLMLFGGVSNIEKEPESAGNEFWMAILGPLTSLAIGVVLVVIVRVTAGPTQGGSVANPIQAISHYNPLETLLAWLGSINIILAAFNMVPGFPLDGGRVLRSILWALTGNFRRATRYASWVGQGIAWVMIGTGIAMVFGVQIPFFGSGLIGGLWLAFIGWFLHTAATQSYQQVVVHDILENVPVQQMMRRNPPTVAADSSVSTLVHEHVMGTDERGFPVLDGEKLVGMVTLQDIREVPREQWEQVMVRQIMTPVDQLETVAPNSDAADAMRMLQRRDVRQLPVLDGTRLVGMLRRQDLMRWLQMHSDSVRG